MSISKAAFPAVLCGKRIWGSDELRKHCLSVPRTPPPLRAPQGSANTPVKAPVGTRLVCLKLLLTTGFVFFFVVVIVILQLQNNILQSTLWKSVPQMFLKVPPSLWLVQGEGYGVWGCSGPLNSAKHLCPGANCSSCRCHPHGMNASKLSCQAPEAGGAVCEGAPLWGRLRRWGRFPTPSLERGGGPGPPPRRSRALSGSLCPQHSLAFDKGD